MTYPIITVPIDSAIGDEQLGSKNKFWFVLGNDRWLFKESRPETGEDWAEKVASEIAARIGIPAAHVELAEFEGRRGSASKSFIETQDTLVHGNEILAGQIVGYDRTKRLKQSDHTLGNIVEAVRHLFDQNADAQEGVLTQLVTYLVLDALIGNTDRHHENWGLLVRVEPAGPTNDVLMKLRVAPSFDHASSLGRELRDDGRRDMLDRDKVEAYVRRGRGGIYQRATDRWGANPLGLVEYGARYFPRYFREPLAAVTRVPLSQILSPLEEVPEERMSRPARDFAAAVLTNAYEALRKLNP